MLDANGREVQVGDWVATPYPADDLVGLPERIRKAIVGQVIQIAEDFLGEFVHLGNGIVYGPDEIVTLGGLEFVTCPECGQPWVFDVRMNTEEECPFCDYLLVWELYCLESCDWGNGSPSPEAGLRKAALNRGRP